MQTHHAGVIVLAVHSGCVEDQVQQRGVMDGRNLLTPSSDTQATLMAVQAGFRCEAAIELRNERTAANIIRFRTQPAGRGAISRPVVTHGAQVLLPVDAARCSGEFRLMHLLHRRGHCCLPGCAGGEDRCVLNAARHCRCVVTYSGGAALQQATERPYQRHAIGNAASRSPQLKIAPSPLQGCTAGQLNVELKYAS